MASSVASSLADGSGAIRGRFRLPPVTDGECPTWAVYRVIRPKAGKGSVERSAVKDAAATSSVRGNSSRWCLAASLVTVPTGYDKCEL